MARPDLKVGPCNDCQGEACFIAAREEKINSFDFSAKDGYQNWCGHVTR